MTADNAPGRVGAARDKAAGDEAAFDEAARDATANAWADCTPPDAETIAALAEAAIAALPAPYRNAARAVALRIEDFAADEMLDEMGIEDPFELTGLYDGIPLTQKSVMDQPIGPDAIWLFRRPILDEWAHRGDVSLGALVSHILVHELAHHFGWSDDDIAHIDPWWE